MPTHELSGLDSKRAVPPHGRAYLFNLRQLLGVLCLDTFEHRCVNLLYDLCTAQQNGT